MVITALSFSNHHICNIFNHSLTLFGILLDASAEDSFQQPELFDFDHIHFNSNIASPVAILYGALGTDCFKEFHVNLVQAAKEVFTISIPNFLIVLFCSCN